MMANSGIVSIRVCSTPRQRNMLPAVVARPANATLHECSGGFNDSRSLWNVDINISVRMDKTEAFDATSGPRLRPSPNYAKRFRNNG